MIKEFLTLFPIFVAIVLGLAVLLPIFTVLLVTSAGVADAVLCSIGNRAVFSFHCDSAPIYQYFKGDGL